MKLWRYGKDDSLNTTETRAVLAVKLTQFVFGFLGVLAVAAICIAFFTKGKTTISPSDTWVDIVIATYAFLAALHGVAWVGGWTKQKTAETVAKADAIRSGAPPTSTTTTTTTTKAAAPPAPKNLVAAPDAVIPSEAPTPIPPEAREDISEDEIP